MNNYNCCCSYLEHGLIFCAGGISWRFVPGSRQKNLLIKHLFSFIWTLITNSRIRIVSRAGFSILDFGVFVQVLFKIVSRTGFTILAFGVFFQVLFKIEAAIGHSQLGHISISLGVERGVVVWGDLSITRKRNLKLWPREKATQARLNWCFLLKFYKCPQLTKKGPCQMTVKIKKYIQTLAKTWIYPTPYIIKYICTVRIFDSRPFIYNKIFLKKTLIEVISSHIYASFCTFCVQIGQLLSCHAQGHWFESSYGK